VFGTALIDRAGHDLIKPAKHSCRSNRKRTDFHMLFKCSETGSRMKGDILVVDLSQLAMKTVGMPTVRRA